MRIVFFAMRIASATSEGLSFISTMSAASTAAALPMEPMAMPTSERESTGASLMPSPTNATILPSPLPAISSSTFFTLSSGIISAQYMSSPRSSATSFAMSSLSPVSITVRVMPWAFSARIASFASSFSTSAITM